MATSDSRLNFIMFIFCYLVVLSSGLFLGLPCYARRNIAASSLTENPSQFEHKEDKSEQEKIAHPSHRELLTNINKPIATILHDDIIIPPPTTVLPATPITNPVTTPATVPFLTPTPTTVTIPSTDPVITTPTYPTTTVPSTTPVVINPINPPLASPVPTTLTNPVTTYPFPPPAGGTPDMTPIMTPPVTTNSPMVMGQTWCVAKTESLEISLQAALDYACGIGRADCSPIQQTGSCYNPNSLQRHASYAFNSYYQKNPSPTNCDFGGTGIIVNTNPSSGSCLYLSSTASTSSSSSVLNSAEPAMATPNAFGSEPPPNSGNLVSASTCRKPLFPLVVIVASFITGNWKVMPST
ncbi:hypothetical protein GIB67_024850 [Kingdonia uniflora]|uniref:X8 domain-containing protein n=1 Tax=Kingdonia uniflora TaxID=39325 RepID=A0A7J7NZ70_9MAGN|nr:hypothetical protein GIB67_024850 [Kingdonia uniflora]